MTTKKMPTKTTKTKPIPKELVKIEDFEINEKTNLVEDSRIAQLTSEKDASDKKFAELQAQMNLLMQQMSMRGNVSTSQVAEEVEIGCRLFSGGVICNKTEDIMYSFGYSEIKEIPLVELKECFRNQINNYKDLFAKGCFYFLDESYYKEFKIREFLDLSEETIVDMLINKGVAVPYQSEMMVNGHRENIVYLTVLYVVADLYREGKLQSWDFNKKKSFETYYNKRIDDVASVVSVLKK